MRLVTFTHSGKTRIGSVVEGEVVDLSAAAPELPERWTDVLTVGPAAMEQVVRASRQGGPRIPLAQVHLEAPILKPSKFLGVGLNYADHAAESGRTPPENPLFFNKQSSCVQGPYDPIHLPRVSRALDYEGELGFVIGRRCRHVPEGRGEEVIAGYLAVDDVSVRDWQRRAPTWTLGKSFDTHGPIGPWIVTPDEIGGPSGLRIQTWVNDTLRQDSNTRELIFPCGKLVEYLTTVFTLEPGDLITTGTPSGVAISMDPPAWLRAGDTVRVEIEGIGYIENRVIPEPEDTPLF